MKSTPETLSLAEIARAFREGQLKAVELTVACIGNRHEHLSAYKSWRPETARDLPPVKSTSACERVQPGL